MKNLLDLIGELTALLPPGKVEAAANLIREAKAPPDLRSLDGLVGTAAARELSRRVLDAWSHSGLSSDLVAGMLVGASSGRQRAECEQSVELVWTGPTTPFVPTRRTEQVLLDVIRSAKRDLFLVSFVAYDVSSVVSALNEACQHGVELRLLLESSASQGGSLSVDPVGVMRRLVPAAELHVWRDKAEQFTDGRVHAKLAVADGRVAFITSANLTGHALEKNMEAGVLIRGGRLPNALRSHLDALVDTKVIVRA